MNTLLYLTLLLFVTFVYSQTEVNFVHPLTNLPSTSSDIETRSYFPQLIGGGLGEKQNFLAGENVQSLCHFTNKGDSPYNITAIMGSLNAVADFGFYIQNFSYVPVGLTLRPEEEVSLEYAFEPHKTLPENDYQVAITVFYENENEKFSITYFNETISVSQSEPETDAESVMAVLAGFGFLFAVIYAVLVLMFPNSSASKKFFEEKKETYASVVASNIPPAPKKKTRKD